MGDTILNLIMKCCLLQFQSGNIEKVTYLCILISYQSDAIHCFVIVAQAHKVTYSEYLKLLNLDLVLKKITVKQFYTAKCIKFVQHAFKLCSCYVLCVTFLCCTGLMCGV